MNKQKLPIIKHTEKYENLLYVESVYSLALYLHLFPFQENTLFVIVESIATQELLDELSNVIVISKKTKINDFDRFLLKLGILPKKIKFLENYLTDNLKIYGHDHLRLSSFFFSKGGCVIEDGLANYKPQNAVFQYGPISKSIKSLLNPCKCYPFGWNKKVKKIYLTGLEKIPAELAHKVKVVDRDEFIKNLNNILNGYFAIEKKYGHTENKVLILTQTFCTTHVLSDNRKVEIYRNIVNMFIDKGFVVSLKPHPRDRTDYSSITNTNIVPSHVLAESFYNYFSKIVSISSSATPPKLSTETVEFIQLGGQGLTELSDAAQKTKCSNLEYKLTFNNIN